MTRYDAGTSAAARAAGMRAKAERLQQAADRWDQGAEGERLTASLLEPLVEKGWTIFHDLAVPGSKANIDHVVVGPSGVTLIDTKAYAGKLTIRKGTLWHGKFPLRREVDAILFETGALQQVVTGVAPDVVAHPLVCVHGAEAPTDHDGVLDPIQICSAYELVDRLTAGTADDALSPARVGAISMAIATTFARRASTASTHAARSQKSVVSPREPGSALRRAPKGRSLLEPFLRVAVAIVVAIALLKAAPAVGDLASNAVTSSVDPTTTTVVGVPAGDAGT